MPEGFKIQLESGQKIRLKSLNQYFIYDGLLEGLPTTRMNEGIINEALKNAIRPHREGSPYLIQPTETPIEYRGGKEYPFGTPSALPGIVCEAHFQYVMPARDKSQDYSWLIIVWFQNEFALPIDESVMKKIKALDWNAIANDDEF